MDVKEAVGIAKRYVIDLFADEGIAYVGLEEVLFDEHSEDWRVTIGFAPHWNQLSAISAALSGGQRDSHHRAYKVVRIRDSDGRVISLTDRLLADRAD